MSALRGLHLHVDCASGIAGDMMLGALIDLGVPLPIIGDALDKIGAGRSRLHVTRVMKHGIAAVDVKVDTGGQVIEAHDHVSAGVPIAVPRRAATESGPRRAATEPGAHRRASTESGPSNASGSFVAIKFRSEAQHLHVHVDEHGDKHIETTPIHAHSHGHHSHGHDQAHDHYHYADIRKRIERAGLTEGTQRRALDIFDRIARAEAKLHGMKIEDVSFHEVGAIDSIVDIVGTAAALDWLQPAKVSCASVAMGHGTLTCAHGVLPVPAPAALEVLREAGGVMSDGGVARELCTPTGAGILAATVTDWTPAPTGRPIAVGWGAGDSDLEDRANVVRLVAVKTSAGTDNVWQIDANLDDMSPELCGPASDALFAAGALDVWWTPITMKKGRPALTLSALADEPERDQVIAAILRETTTIGVRYAQLQRTVLERSMLMVTTKYGTLPIKVARDGEGVRNVAPEYEACALAARTFGVPVKLVFAAALAAYEAETDA
ncbi:MAG: hypothetical protein JWO36_901 [Myxococcales bacterium]|nr:hypothetical protein [Myxococcales bacterium]